MAKWCVVLIAVFSLVSAFGTSVADQAREATLGYISEGNQSDGIATFGGYLERQLSSTKRIPSSEIVQLSTVAACVRLMELSENKKVSAVAAEWLLTSPARLYVFIDLLKPQDRFVRCMEILETLREYDPADCDAYSDLIFAIAVVMDDPGNGKMHGQMGRNLLPVEKDPVKVYDYFKTLYAGDAKMDYEKLGASELVFVVEPAPISELEWARENTKGSLSGWGKRYSEIEYDHERLNNSRYSWDRGGYTLEEILNQGGICVDQAYYSVLTARAWGIPALYFRGSGKSANHAWFSFMKGRGDWVLDIGRYQGGSYTTGFAVNPQLRRTMTDHDVQYTCEGSLHSPKSQLAAAYLLIAQVLEKRYPDGALKCTKLARGYSKKMLPVWELENRILRDQKDCDALVELFGEMKDAFRKYPDILIDTAKLAEKTLRENGENEAAEKLMRSAGGVVGNDRDDISRMFENERISQIIKSGDMKKARKEMEQLLDEHKNEGNKVLGLIRQYIKLTKDSGQTREAVRFMEDYIEDQLQENQFPPGYEETYLKLLLNVYENGGETREAEELKVRIRRLQDEQRR